MTSITRRSLFGLLAALAATARAKTLFADPALPVQPKDYHGYDLHDLSVDGQSALLVKPKNPLPGNPWVWRTLFWGSFQDTDVAFLAAGFHVAYIGVGNTFGCSDAMRHFDAFYTEMTSNHGLGARPALEGLSRGGLYAYRWAYVNASKVGCIYGDAPVCDMKSWPGGKGKGSGSPSDWAEAIKDYHFANEQEMLDFEGNPIDILAPIAAASIPIIHVCGDSDKTVPESENTDIVRTRYMALGGSIAVIVKQGCDHHPHGLKDPTPVVNFVIAHCAHGSAAEAAAQSAPKAGSILRLQREQWDYAPIKPA